MGRAERLSLGRPGPIPETRVGSTAAGPSFVPMDPLSYVHGYTEDESTRLRDQAVTLEELLHCDTTYPAGSRVLEAGCGVGAQTVHLLRHSPEAHFTLVDCNVDSLAAARAAIGSTSADISRVTFSHADLFAQAHGGGDANIGRRLYPC